MLRDLPVSTPERPEQRRLQAGGMRDEAWLQPAPAQHGRAWTKQETSLTCVHIREHQVDAVRVDLARQGHLVLPQKQEARRQEHEVPCTTAMRCPL